MSGLPDVIQGQELACVSSVPHPLNVIYLSTSIYLVIYKVNISGFLQIHFSECICCFVIFQSLSQVQHFATPRTAALQALLSFTISQSLLRFTSIESVMLSNQLILCHPLLLLPSIFPSIRVFSIQSALCTPSGGQSIGAQLQHQCITKAIKLKMVRTMIGNCMMSRVS